MKRLLLLRHAKSSWDDPELDDHDRPLAARGRRAATLVAEHLRERAPARMLVLCSSARRTRETLDHIAPALGEIVAVQVETELYDASAERLLERLRAVDDGVDSVLLIGHNTAIEELALLLAGSGSKLPSVRRKYPTGALASLELPAAWSELRPGVAVLVDFVTPKELASSGAP
jgi:phosphohistidine phosphatase